VPQVALPLGGLGAGSVSINAYGGFQDFAIRHQPALSAVADGWRATDAAFALLHVRGRSPITRLVEGPMPVSRIYDQGLKAQGYRSGGHEGLPRFAKAAFKAEFPFASVKLDDPAVPLGVELTAWSPFVPGDDVASGMPCAILEYTLVNRTRQSVAFDFSFHLSNLVHGGDSKELSSRSEVMPRQGVHFFNVEDAASEAFASAALASIGHPPRIKAMWFRGGWFDSISALWREVSTESFTTNEGSNPNDTEGRSGGSILFTGGLPPGRRITYTVVVAWHFPNSNQRHGTPKRMTPPELDRSPGPAWRPFYAGQWRDARAVAQTIIKDYKALRERTSSFSRALRSSTLPPPVIDAVSSNLAILKSPSILRQENGNVWGWEGCFPDRGSCHGSCTHVYNYAQALAHLFPKLERTLREQELERSMDDRGHVNFRSSLPDGPVDHDWHAAADGQLGGMMKVYRDWQISGDEAWLRRMYPLARRSLDYCIRTWDPDGRGALFEPHHNTYDIEFWGPDGMCTTIYVGALSAMAVMARTVGEAEDAARYEKLAKAGAAFLESELWNGEYFVQRVMTGGLRDRSFSDKVAAMPKESKVAHLLRHEGPKYQYGAGCLSDGVIGAWMADLYGVATPLDADSVTKNLMAIVRHNFKRDLADHACTQRPGYATGHEPGLLLCSWPNGKKPTLPFPYSDEVWTGIEYQVASHCILHGLVDEGLSLVRAARGRYDGRVRNPFDEYECGSFYVRALASYALLGALSGFRYSAVDRCLWFAPRLSARPFKCFFSTQGAWGTISLDAKRITINVEEGELAIEKIVVGSGKREIAIEQSAVVKQGTPLATAVGREADGTRKRRRGSK
jgi:uncharacterized protein (DUF608 family)